MSDPQLTAFSGQERTRVSLLQRVQEGQETAWFEFYDKYAAMIRSVGLKHNLSPAECDDLMVDVMLIFWRKMDSFFYDPRKGRFRSYLSKIALFASLRRRDKNNAAPAANEEIPDYPAELDDTVMEEWKEFILNEALEELKESVDSEVFQIFFMSFVQNRPTEEISRITRRSANNIYVIRSRCLKKLREITACYRELEESELRRRSNKNA
jgi:RNA polymerase sigma factor (sigma-70 family)